MRMRFPVLLLGYDVERLHVSQRSFQVQAEASARGTKAWSCHGHGLSLQVHVQRAGQSPTIVDLIDRLI